MHFAFNSFCKSLDNNLVCLNDNTVELKTVLILFVIS